MARVDEATILALIDTIAQGDLETAWEAAHRLVDLNSRRYGRRLIQIARKPATIHAQQSAIYAIWLLGEARACHVLLRIGADVQGQSETSRLMAVEALGSCDWRHDVEAALIRHLSDPAITVRYSALCALSAHFRHYPPSVIDALRQTANDTSFVYKEGDIAELANELLTRQVQHD